MSVSYPSIPPVRVVHADKHDANTVQYWGFFRREELEAAPADLLMLDIDFGRVCSLACPSCFRRANRVDEFGERDLSCAELLAVIDEARAIGVREVKVCGAGEPLETPNLLPFAEELTARGVGLAVFTKGHVFGDDDRVGRLYGRYGVQDGQELSQRFFDLKVSFLVSFQSPDSDVQEELVGGMAGYSRKRDRGLERLAGVGFNKYSPTRLAICANPILRCNYQYLYEIYVYARERNILPVNAALMVSGKQINAHFLSHNDISPTEKIELYRRIYEYNLGQGLDTVDQLAADGISCMPGIHPCNQIAAGLYLTANGTVVRCPGDSGAPLGNVRRESIRDIWLRHREWPFKGRFNCGCPFKDGATIPRPLYEMVLEAVLGWGVPA
jgi:MoaA/NifB/PqqE/SkfB family radical SAM enzyme